MIYKEEIYLKKENYMNFYMLYNSKKIYNYLKTCFKYTWEFNSCNQNLYST